MLSGCERRVDDKLVDRDASSYQGFDTVSECSYSNALVKGKKELGVQLCDMYRERGRGL